MAAEEPKEPNPLALKITPLIKDLESTIARAHDQLLAIKVIVAGGNPVGDAMDYFNTAWRTRYGSNYIWNKKQDPAAIKRLLRAMPIGELKARMGFYLNIDDQFYAKNQHPFGIFASAINAFSRTTGNTFNCSHTPPCKNDVEHTQRKLKEARA